MRRRSRFWAGLIVVSPLLGAGAAACGRSDSNEPPLAAAPDGSAGDAPASVEAALGLIAGNSTTYVQQRVRLGASASIPADVKLAWTFESKPPNSTITDAAIDGAATMMASFVPDVSGTFALRVTADDGATSATKTVFVTAVDAPIFYLAERAEDAAAVREMRVIGANGAGGGALTCPVRQKFAAAPDPYYTALIAAAGVDYWEAPAGGVSRAAFVLPGDEGQDAEAGPLQFTLSTTTTAAGCASGSGGSGDRRDVRRDTIRLLQPKISPDGRRIAYVRDVDVTTKQLWVIGFDGSEDRLLTTSKAVIADLDGAAPADLFAPARAEWIDTHRLAWVTLSKPLNAPEWRVNVLEDAPDPKPQLLCTGMGLRPDQIAFLADGTFLGSVRKVINEAGALTTSLVHFRVQGGACQEAEAIVNNAAAPANEFANDFAVSPDRKAVAFLRGGDDRPATLHVASLDPPGPAVEISDVPSAYGPRWVAGGALLTWSAQDPRADASQVGTAVVVAALEGGLRPAVLGTGNKVYGIGNGYFPDSYFRCSSGAPGLGGSAATLGASLALIVALVRRRRR